MYVYHELSVMSLCTCIVQDVCVCVLQVSLLCSNILRCVVSVVNIKKIIVIKKIGFCMYASSCTAGQSALHFTHGRPVHSGVTN